MRENLTPELHAAQAERAEGFSARIAGCSCDSTEARAGACSGVVFAGTGIPEGGRSPAPQVEYHESSPFPAGQVLPEAFTSPKVQEAVQGIQQAARKPRKLHQLDLTEREFLHTYYAVEHDRSRTRKAISKGHALPEDLKATDGLWDKLQAIYFARAKGGAA